MGTGKNKIISVPATQDRNRNYQKYFLLFGTGTIITKKLSCYSRREQETKTPLPFVWEPELKAFQLGNIEEQKFPLMPVLIVFDHLNNFLLFLTAFNHLQPFWNVFNGFQLVLTNVDNLKKYVL